jgi:hypothetical protein
VAAKIGTTGVTVPGVLSVVMPADDIVLLSARNSFLVLLLLLLAISTYQFYTIRGVTNPVAAMWVTAAGVFYLSKWYYGRQTDTETDSG